RRVLFRSPLSLSESPLSELLRTRVPLPWRLSNCASAFKASYADMTVVLLTERAPANWRSDGSLAPAGISPSSISDRSASLNWRCSAPLPPDQPVSARANQETSIRCVERTMPPIFIIVEVELARQYQSGLIWDGCSWKWMSTWPNWTALDVL